MEDLFFFLGLKRHDKRRGSNLKAYLTRTLLAVNEGQEIHN
jgi:hypothetical protein